MSQAREANRPIGSSGYSALVASVRLDSSHTAASARPASASGRASSPRIVAGTAMPGDEQPEEHDVGGAAGSELEVAERARHGSVGGDAGLGENPAAQS